MKKILKKIRSFFNPPLLNKEQYRDLIHNKIPALEMLPDSRSKHYLLNVCYDLVLDYERKVWS